MESRENWRRGQEVFLSMIFSGAWAWVRGSDTDKLGDRQCQRLQPLRYLLPARPHARQPQHPELTQPGS